MIKNGDKITYKQKNINIDKDKLLNSIINVSNMDKNDKPIQCKYINNYINVSYMINEDIKHIKWQYQYTITDITHENWIQLLMQYANKIDNKKLISFVYNEVNKIP